MLPERDASLCRFIVDVVPGKLPPYPICYHVGRSIEGPNSSTKYQRHKLCPFLRYTNNNCQVVNSVKFEQVIRNIGDRPIRL